MAAGRVVGNRWQPPGGRQSIMVRAFRDSDTGMEVVTDDGETVGTIAKIDGNTAHVEPQGGLAKSIRQRLGWGDDDDEMYELPHRRVKSFSGSKIHLKD
jgi:hypothetical protein